MSIVFDVPVRVACRGRGGVAGAWQKKCGFNQQQETCRLRLKCDGTRAETRFRLSGNGRVHLNRRGRQFSRLLAAEVCASAVVMLDTQYSDVV